MRPVQDFEVTATRLQTVKFTVAARTPEEAESIVETMASDEGTVLDSTIESVDALPVEEVQC
jgi:hypothetical protein